MKVLERTPDPDDYVKVGLGLMELELMANHHSVVELEEYRPLPPVDYSPTHEAP